MKKHPWLTNHGASLVVAAIFAVRNNRPSAYARETVAHVANRLPADSRRVPLFVAVEKGHFDKAGIQVD